jgi:WD40 repeat protein
LQGSLEGLNDVAFTCDSRTLLGAEDRAAVRLWEVEKGRLRPVALTGHKDKVTGVATSPTHHDVAYTCSSDRTIKVLIMF